MEEATTKINDIYINKYKTHDVINSLDELCGKHSFGSRTKCRGRFVV
jgi:hypothetical protein